MRNGSKQTIFTKGGFRLLQMVSRSVTWCTLKGSGLCDLASMEESNEAFFIRMWKSLFKSLETDHAD